MAIIGILAAMLLPALTEAREKAKYARWLGYKNSLRCDDRLVAYYDFEQKEGATLRNQAVGMTGDVDYVPENLDGTLKNNPTWTKAEGRWTGKGALEFNGVDDYVSIELNLSETFAFGGPITVEYWAKGLSSSTGYIIASGLVGGAPDLLSRNNYSSGKTAVRLYGGDWALSDNNLDDGKWHHVVWGTDGTNYFFFVDGVAQSEVPSNPVGATDTAVWLGRRKDKECFNGLIDEVAIYNCGLTASEIKDHYKMGAP